MSQVRTTVTRMLWRMRKAQKNSGAIARTPQPATSGVGDPNLSAVSIDVPMSIPSVHDEYISYSGRLRMGKIMEDLDAVAGTVAFRHCGPGPRIVTAAVDAVEVFRDPPAADLRVDGRVTFVGRTSLEITATVSALPRGTDAGLTRPGEDVQGPDDGFDLRPCDNAAVIAGRGDDAGAEPCLRAVFLMAARDRDSGKGFQVPSLDVPDADPVSAALWKRGEENRALRKAERSLSPLQLRAGGERPFVESVFLAQPQQRNLAGHIFGGWLIRRAVETAMAAAHIAAGPGGDPFVLAIDEIAFERPVKVGDIARLDAHVIFATDRAAVIAVETWIVDVSRENGDGERALTFSFTIGLGRDAPVSAVRGVDPGGPNWERGAHIWNKARAIAEAEGGLVDAFGSTQEGL